MIKNPKLWWPNGYGDQPLYDLDLQFVNDRKVSHQQQVRFGVRQITCEMHERDGHYGRRILINGQKIFARGGYIQPDMLLDWTPERIDKEVRYYARANLNLVYFEDIANPPDFLFDACDRYGVMIGQCFYGCSWMQSGSKYPADVPLVIECSRDILKRIRNHPSLVMYMASIEGFTREEVYRPWRKSVIELDGTRFWVSSNGMPNTTPDKVQPWFRDDMPTGMTDLGFNTYGWEEPSEYYHRVRDVPNWMFMVESGSASLPSLSSLEKSIPKLGEVEPGPLFPLDATWTHHGANKYYEPYDAAVRRVFGQATTVGDYVWQGHLVTADQHRAICKVINPTDRLAFFVQLALTRGRSRPEILPVLWEDNYFSLMPGESREISARFASADAGSVKPVLELGGWNVETEFECQALDVSPATIKAGEALELTATVGNTFLDGSRVFAYWDGQPVASAVAFGRQGRIQRVRYQLKANSAGAHEVRIGNKQVQVSVQP